MMLIGRKVDESHMLPNKTLTMMVSDTSFIHSSHETNTSTLLINSCANRLRSYFVIKVFGNDGGFRRRARRHDNQFPGGKTTSA